MANRSKKVVLSARIEPYLKAGLELYAASKNEKIVKLLEQVIENALEDIRIKNPFLTGNSHLNELSLHTLMAAIWSEDELVYKLRAGLLGPRVAGERTADIALQISASDYFKGDFDLYGDLNGLAGRMDLEPVYRYMFDLEKVRGEWDLVCDYVDFLLNNKPFSPTYDDYKRMRLESAR